MKNAAISRIFIFIIVILLTSIILSTLNFNVEAGDSMITIWGEVYDSDGNGIPRGFEGEDVEVIVKHDGKKTSYDDPDGIQYADHAGTYVYAVTIPANAWDEGDEFWVRVDGREWGDLDHVCRGHDDTSEYKWDISNPANIRKDVNTSDTQFVWDEEETILIFMIIGFVIAFIVIILVWKYGPWKK
jgi:hypothetical protein